MIRNIIASPVLHNITQSTRSQVGIEIGLKSVGRPGFILFDKSIDDNTKKYSATKEFIYQLTCLALSMAIVVPIFKKGPFSLARKLFKDEPIFKVFKNSDKFNEFNKINPENKINKLRELYGEHSSKYSNEQLKNHINMAKGMIETTSIAGSVLSLSVIAPMISRPFIRPFLKKFGFSKNKQII